MQNWSHTRFLLLVQHDETLREQNIRWNCANSVKQTSGRKGVAVRQSHGCEKTRCICLCVFSDEVSQLWQKHRDGVKGDFFDEEVSLTSKEFPPSPQLARGALAVLVFPLVGRALTLERLHSGCTRHQFHVTDRLPKRKKNKKTCVLESAGWLTNKQSTRMLNPTVSRGSGPCAYQASHSTGWTWVTVTEIGRRNAIFLEAYESCCHAESRTLSWCLLWTRRRSGNRDFIWHSVSGPRGKTALKTLSCPTYVHWYENQLGSPWYKTLCNYTLSVYLNTGFIKLLIYFQWNFKTFL